MKPFSQSQESIERIEEHSDDMGSPEPLRTQMGDMAMTNKGLLQI